MKWTIYGLLEAEENGITQANVDELKASSKDPVVGRILGSTEDTGKLLGLDKEWMLHAVKATGNYGEIFERNVGMKSVAGPLDSVELGSAPSLRRPHTASQGGGAASKLTR